jgi:Glycosyl transferase 4-like domain
MQALSAWNAAMHWFARLGLGPRGKRRMVMNVSPLTNCSLLLSLSHGKTSSLPLAADDQNEVLLAAFLFFDQEGAPLTGRFATFEHSDRFENFLRVPGFNDCGEQAVNLEFRTPRKAASMAVDILPGRLKHFRLTTPPKLSVSPEEILRKEIAQHQKRGALSAALAAAEKRYALTGWPVDARNCGEIRGQLRELDPDWLPSVSSRREPLPAYEDGAPLRIIHLIKSTRLDSKGDGAAGTHETLTAQAALGMIAMGLTPIGDPGADLQGSQGGEGDALYDRIAFPASDAWSKLPADERLRYDTFFSAISLRRFKPHVIHAHWGERGFELALKGLALREMFGLPLVYEVREPGEHVSEHGDADPSTERNLLRRMQSERCMREADAVVVASDAIRTDLADRGIDAAKIHVIPSADAKAYRDLYEGLLSKDHVSRDG